jgi:hypothetical protein
MGVHIVANKQVSDIPYPLGINGATLSMPNRIRWPQGAFGILIAHFI